MEGPLNDLQRVKSIVSRVDRSLNFWSSRSTVRYYDHKWDLEKRDMQNARIRNYISESKCRFISDRRLHGVCSDSIWKSAGHKRNTRV